MVQLLIALALTLATACSSQPAANAATPDGDRSQQQVIVDRAAEAVDRVRAQPRFEAIEMLLPRAHAVLIFPKLIKASLILGGEGGNGVMLVRAEDGSFSSPAFYSMGAPSIGFQAGFRESTALLFVMNETTVHTLLHSSMTLGAQTSATLGQVGERGLTEGDMVGKDIYVITEAGGAFAGVSLDGYVIASREAHNERYYGAGATPRDILIRRQLSNPGASELQQALRVEPAQLAGAEQRVEPKEPEQGAASTPSTQAPAADSETASTAGSAPAVAAAADDIRKCSPESRLAASCKEQAAEVCATLTQSCDHPPCEPERRSFPNACEACRDERVEGYRPGKCE